MTGAAVPELVPSESADLDVDDEPLDRRGRRNVEALQVVENNTAIGQRVSLIRLYRKRLIIGSKRVLKTSEFAKAMVENM